MPSKPKAESNLLITALNALARREHARCELARKLSGRGFEHTAVEKLLDQLESEELLSDNRFAASYVSSRKQRGFGPLRIKLELRQRGVDEGLIRAHTDNSESEWLDLARQQCNKRFGQKKKVRDAQEFARRARFLQGRGFSDPMIMDVLKELE